MSTQARALIEASIAEALTRRETIIIDLAATKRRRERLLAKRTATEAEIDELTSALDSLGGPLPKEEDDQP